MDVPAKLYLLVPLLLMVLLPHTAKCLFNDNGDKNERVTTRETFSPFRIFWNVPHHQCVNHYPFVDMNAKLASYGIEAYYNKDKGTEGVNIYYTTHLKWPYIKDGKWYNGGLPQYADVKGHLSALRERVNTTTLPTYTGLGVLDMEEFRPLLYSNYGRLRFLREVQLNETARLYPNITSKRELRAKATETYKTGARIIMEASLNEVLEQRPDMKWGYYGYPQGSMIGHENDAISWLWNITTAFYPSLYIYNRTDPRLEITDMKTISETFRVRAKYGDPDAPVYVYHRVEDSKGYFYNETLNQVVDATLKKGVDGIVIWASSSLFHHNRSLQCERLVSYVDNVLGPRIVALRKRMTDCSNQLCEGHGRCVSQFYVGKVEHVLDRGVPQPEIPLAGDKRPDMKNTEKEFLDDYACQCYKNWTGRWCRLRRS